MYFRSTIPNIRILLGRTLVYQGMVEAKPSEFMEQVSKNMGDYVTDESGNPYVESVGPYIIELYENILSRKAQRESDKQKGAVSISKKTKSGEYTVLGSNVFEELGIAKMEYNSLVTSGSDRIEAFMDSHGIEYEEE